MGSKTGCLNTKDTLVNGNDENYWIEIHILYQAMQFIRLVCQHCTNINEQIRGNANSIVNQLFEYIEIYEPGGQAKVNLRNMWVILIR